MIFARHSIPNVLRAAAKTAWRLVGPEPVIATDAVQAVREVRCWNCPHFVHPQCALCTCVVDLKTRLAAERCPVGRWEPQTRFSNGLPRAAVATT